jgi:UDP-glucuronate 4-epimerase
MAYFSFVKDIIEGKPIQVYNKGMLSRDFTYVDDIVRSIQLLIDRFDIITADVKYHILNIGNSNPVTLIDFIQTIEESLGKEAIKEVLGMQSGDVFSTYADVTALSALIDYKPVTKLSDGIGEFVKWFKSYYYV